MTILCVSKTASEKNALSVLTGEISILVNGM